jgi:hypothetical protein
MDTEKTEQATNGSAKTKTDAAKKPIIDQMTDLASRGGGDVS